MFKPSSRSSVLNSSLFVLFLVSTILLPTSVVDAAVCARGNVPAATLLLPYFEVDTAAPGGQTTLFSVGNSAGEPTLAFVTVWSDWGVPVLGFYLHLGPEEVKTINLRDVVQARQIPALDLDPEAFPGCVDAPLLLGSSAEQLQLQLTGQPDPESAGCFGRDRGETSLALGFVTVDVADDCTSLDSIGQWVKDGLAGERNVLWGEIFYIDPDQDSAQGRNAVSIRHDPSVGAHKTFYPNSLARLPLELTWRTRYITGAGVDAETEVILWGNTWVGLDQEAQGFSCEPLNPTDGVSYNVRLGDQSGSLGGKIPFGPVGSVTRKFTLDELLPEIERPENGVLEIEAVECFCLTIPTFEPSPSVVWPVFKAEGRFSLALEATPINGFCPDEP